MSQKLSDTLSAIDTCLTELHTKISSLQEKHPNYELFANSSNFPRDANAKTNLTLAFALNSLYFSTLRMTHTDRPQEVKQHPVHAQIKIVRDHYVKFDHVVVKRRKQKEGETAITRIVERTVNENQRIIKEQQAELSKARKRAESSSSESSSEESESESEEV
jgi:mRNA-degrading endonuclease YafQ of YafQ-DinJ toxin-antitoxin module